MKHAVIWIDRKEARIFEVDADELRAVSIVDSPGHHLHRHPEEADLRVRNHPDDEHRYFREVARALEGRGQVLLVGPAQTKLHFFRYLHQHDRPLETGLTRWWSKPASPRRRPVRLLAPAGQRHSMASRSRAGRARSRRATS